MKKLTVDTAPTRRKIVPLVLSVANKIMKELGFKEAINKAVKWDRDHWNISPGGLLHMFVLSTFSDIRIPLTHLEDRLQGIDVEFLLNEPRAKSYLVNESNVGEAMDRLSDTDYESLYETLALSAVLKYEMPITRMNSDTTTISFYGEYDEETMELSDEERETMLHIEKGYNKDGRPGCKQTVVGEITNEYGVPLTSRALDGSTSDKEWNSIALDYVQKIQESGFDKGIYVADCKVVFEEHIARMNDPEKRIQFVSRCPASFQEKLEERTIEKAYESGEWVELGAICKGKDATQYRVASFTGEICGGPVRLLVLESDTLKHSAEKSFQKKEKEVETLVSGLGKTSWACLADAEKGRDGFLASKQLKLFDCTVEIEKRVTEKWPKGRRGPKTKPTNVETYHLRAVEAKRNEAAYISFIQKESCIVLISNVAGEMPDEDIVRTYKGQHVVENSFRALKSPQLASVIYLKKPGRVKVLTMLLTFSLLIRALIQYRLRTGLRKHQEENPGVALKVGWNGRTLKNPTFKLFYEHSVNCCFERNTFYDYKFSWPNVETQLRVEPLLKLMGYTLAQLIE